MLLSRHMLRLPESKEFVSEMTQHRQSKVPSADLECAFLSSRPGIVAYCANDIFVNLDDALAAHDSEVGIISSLQ